MTDRQILLGYIIFVLALIAIFVAIIVGMV